MELDLCHMQSQHHRFASFRNRHTFTWIFSQVQFQLLVMSILPILQHGNHFHTMHSISLVGTHIQPTLQETSQFHIQVLITPQMHLQEHQIVGVSIPFLFIYTPSNTSQLFITYCNTYIFCVAFHKSHFLKNSGRVFFHG